MPPTTQPSSQPTVGSANISTAPPPPPPTLWLCPATTTQFVLPDGLASAAKEIITNRLYWISVFDASDITSVDPESMIHLFTTDRDFIYEPFFADFGPLNLGMVYRYCQLLEAKLSSPSLRYHRIVHYTSSDPHQRPNSAFLMAAFCLIVLRKTVTQAYAPFERVHPPFLVYRDATYGTCSYQLSVADCLAGLEHAIKIGWFDYRTFDIASYEYYEKVENGDLNWIIPKKFLAFSGPESRRVDEAGFISFTPDDYVPIFKRLGVNLVIRLNKKQYDKKSFTNRGLEHIDLYFVDGSCPPRDLIYKFLEIAETTKGAIAVHCKAGLGRTGTLIGCYAMKHHDFKASAWIGWNRICRPGSVLGPQQQFLHEMEMELKQLNRPPAPSLRSTSDMPSPVMELADELESLNIRDRRVAEAGDLGQGERLVEAKRRELRDSVKLESLYTTSKGTLPAVSTSTNADKSKKSRRSLTIASTTDSVPIPRASTPTASTSLNVESGFGAATTWWKEGLDVIESTPTSSFGGGGAMLSPVQLKHKQIDGDKRISTTPSPSPHGWAGPESPSSSVTTDQASYTFLEENQPDGFSTPPPPPAPISVTVKAATSKSQQLGDEKKKEGAFLPQLAAARRKASQGLANDKPTGHVQDQ